MNPPAVSRSPEAAIAALIVAPPSWPEAAFRLKVAGVPLAARQGRLLHYAGVREAVALDAVAEGLLRRDGRVGSPFGRAERVLILDGSTLIDLRLLTLVVRAGREAVVATGGDAECRCVAALVDVHPDSPLDARSGWSRLQAAGERRDVLRLSPASIDPYVPSMRRAAPVRITQIARPEDARALEGALLDDSGQGALDWPARYIQPPFERALVRLLWPTPVTPNQISGLTLVLGLLAAALFWRSDFGGGLALALLCGVLDGVDGKLARTKLQMTPIGELEHTADKVVEYAWYLGLGAGLDRGTEDHAFVWLGLAATLGMVANVGVNALGERMLGRELDDAGGFERAVRLIGGRRDTHMFMLLGFGMFGAWQTGLMAVAASAVLTALVRLWRLVVRAREAVQVKAAS